MAAMEGVETFNSSSPDYDPYDPFGWAADQVRFIFQEQQEFEEFMDLPIITQAQAIQQQNEVDAKAARMTALVYHASLWASTRSNNNDNSQQQNDVVLPTAPSTMNQAVANIMDSPVLDLSNTEITDTDITAGRTIGVSSMENSLAGEVAQHLEILDKATIPVAVKRLEPEDICKHGILTAGEIFPRNENTKIQRLNSTTGGQTIQVSPPAPYKCEDLYWEGSDALKK